MPWYDFLLGRSRDEEPPRPPEHTAAVAPAPAAEPPVFDPSSAEPPVAPPEPSEQSATDLTQGPAHLTQVPTELAQALGEEAPTGDADAGAPVVLHNLVTPYGEPSAPPPAHVGHLVGGDAAFVFVAESPAGPVWALAGLTDPGRAWAALTEQSGSTGLVPVLLVGAVGEDHYFDEDGADPATLDPAEVVTTWTARAGSPQLRPSGSDHPGTDIGSALLALVPTTEPWRVLQLLGYRGPANYGLGCGELAAVHRSWFEDFGARVFVLDEASLEFAVERPPARPEQVARVARELFAVDPDEYAHLPSGAKVAATQRWPLWWD